MRSWEQLAARVLTALRLDSIRSKLLAFAVLATLIPSLSTAWLSYVRTKHSHTEKITQNLEGISSQAARELELWIKERLYDLRVFTSSYEVTENLEGIMGDAAERRDPRAAARALARLTDYLKSVQERVGDFTELLVLDSRGEVVARTYGSRPGGSMPVPGSAWLRDLRAGTPVVGRPEWEEAGQRVVVPVGVPVTGSGGRFLGALAGRFTLRTVNQTLVRFVPRPGGRVSLLTEDGILITSSDPGPSVPLRTKLPDAARRSLFEGSGTAVGYTSFRGTDVVGALQPVGRANWAVVAEVETAEAFRQVRELRDLTLAIVAALVIGVGSLGYLLGSLIVRPLNRLAQGARTVAAGDLAVDLPVMSGGEVGHLTAVFNDMVARLRAARQELERLSVTDGLTGLYNRRRLAEAIQEEEQRFERSGRGFALLMADIDRFKEYNDTFGHVAGDQVLARMGVILRELTREVDCAARFGGEEFAIMMPETDLDGAAAVAERIRQRLSEEVIAGGRVTLSIGIAVYPQHGQTPQAALEAADAALYEAKGKGRNRVVRAA